MRADRIAGIYATLGQPNEAFSWLEIAFREHSSSLPNIVFRSEFESLQSDPRFDDLLRRVGRDSAAVKSALPKSPPRRAARLVSVQGFVPDPPLIFERTLNVLLLLRTKE